MVKLQGLYALNPGDTDDTHYVQLHGTCCITAEDDKCNHATWIIAEYHDLIRNQR
jgi:hypothetical protein